MINFDRLTEAFVFAAKYSEISFIDLDPSFSDTLYPVLLWFRGECVVHDQIDLIHTCVSFMEKIQRLVRSFGQIQLAYLKERVHGGFLRNKIDHIFPKFHNCVCILIFSHIKKHISALQITSMKCIVHIQVDFVGSHCCI